MSETEKLAMYCSESPGCICQKCLFHASSRCPYGSCYDDLRAKENPYDKAHPDKPPRTWWSKWNEEGEQAHWCRGGTFYQSQECPSYEEYDKSKHIVQACFESIISKFQDGYISCSIVESVGCEECLRRAKERRKRKKEETMTTYFTKCGREFQKSTNAETTGYHLEEDAAGNIFDQKCAACPFPVEVTEGYGANATHKRWECRAGSEQPCHENTWGGSLDDKCTLRIYSLDHDFCESVIEFARNHPELSASYNQDSSDCRRVVSISCSQNKAGMAAKQELIDKFFPEQEVGSDQAYEPSAEEICDNCGNYKSGGPEVGRCVKKKIVVSRVHPACEDYGPGDVDLGEGDPVPGAMEEEGLFFCSEDDCPFNDRECGCNFDIDEHRDQTWREDVIRAVVSHSCSNDQVKAVYEKHGEDAKPKRPRFNRGGECQEMREDCPCFCAHNDGCAVLLSTGKALEWILKENDVDCDVFREKKESVIKKPDFVIETAPSVIEQGEAAPAFDYSEVDHDTADFLQEKANRITEIRLRSTVAIGRELKEAQDRLANNKTGVFGKWSESIGFKKSTAYNYIRAYEYIVQNLDNIPDLDSIQPSLLFEISKPSAPPELQQAVIDGDITKHKDYIKAMEELKRTEKDLEFWRSTATSAEKNAIARANERDFEANKARDNMQEILRLEQQIDQLKRNSDPAKLEELGGVIKEKQDAINELKAKVAELNDQLNAKPIEAEAVEIREVVPEELGIAWVKSVESAIKTIAALNDTDMERIIKIEGKKNHAYMKSGFRSYVNDACDNMDKLDSAIVSAISPAEDFMKWLEDKERGR